MSESSSPETRDAPWTVLRLLQWTSEFFEKRDSDSPRLDAEVLLAHVLDRTRIELYTAFAEIPDERQRIAFRELVRRRGEGMPVAQLVGYREFYALRLRVDENVLIPRPETEHLVIEALDRAKAMSVSDRPLAIADIGSGSGAIAVALAKHLDNVEITAVDLNPAALKIAIWNAEQHQVDAKIQFVESDLLVAVDSPRQFDIICSNPPYVSETEFTQLPRTVREYEPREALVAGVAGTEVIERILQDSPERLRGGGRLILELSPMIADQCESLAASNGSFTDLQFVKDLEGHRRILSLERTDS